MKKIDNLIKEKFLFTKKSNIFKRLYFMYHKFFGHSKNFKKSYSYGGIDLLLNHLYRDKRKGTYIDVGCHHPIDGNNTYLLHKKGWEGINIDLDPYSVEIFNYFRPKDFNKNAAVSDKEEIIDLYFYHITIGFVKLLTKDPSNGSTSPCSDTNTNITRSKLHILI